MLLSNCAVCKKLRFIKKQEANGLVLGPNSHFKNVPVLGDIF